MICFFFQAEDGIRDKLVTGVQTCALPISPLGQFERAAQPDVLRVPLRPHDGGGRALRAEPAGAGLPRGVVEPGLLPVVGEIGRASCRERVLIMMVVVSFDATDDGVKSVSG